METVYKYLDYRKYIQDYLDEKREKSSSFSLRLLARQVEMNASNLLKILQGQRELSKKGIAKFCYLFSFKSRERDYFETLVLFSRSKKESESQRLFDKLTEIAELKAETVPVEQYEFYKRWYYTATLALLHYKKVKQNDFATIASSLKPAISESDAKRSVQLLLRLGFIIENSENGYTLTQKVLSSGEKWYSLAINNFQRETLELAQALLSKGPREERDFSTVTITCDEASRKEIKRLTAEYRKSILKAAIDSENPDQAYQLNIQFFPVTERGREDE